MLAGNILAIGGDETSDSRGGSEMKEVYMYSSSTDSWIYISDLPAPRVSTAAAVLSSTELLVIGGWNRGRVNTMYKLGYTYITVTIMINVLYNCIVHFRAVHLK